MVCTHTALFHTQRGLSELEWASSSEVGRTLALEPWEWPSPGAGQAGPKGQISPHHPRARKRMAVSNAC